MEPITCTYVFNMQEFRRVLFNFYCTRLRKMFVVAFVVFFILITAPDLFSHFQAHNLSSREIVVLVLTNLVCESLWFAFFLPAMFLYQCWAFKGMSLANSSMNYLLSESGIKLDAGEMKVELTWNAWAFANETPRGFVLYLGQGKRSFHWLPLHGFASLEEYSRCRELIRSKTKSTKLRASMTGAGDQTQAP